MLVLVLSDVLRFYSRAKFTLAVLQETWAEDLQAFVEVFHWENNTGTRCESFDLGASVAQLGQEWLHEAELGYNIQVTVAVNRWEQSWGKLLLRVHVSMDLACSSLLEGCKQRGMLSVDDVKRYLDHLHVYNSSGHTDLSLDLVELGNNRMLSRIRINALKYGLFLLSLLLLQSFLGTSTFDVFAAFFGFIILLGKDVSL